MEPEKKCSNDVCLEDEDMKSNDEEENKIQEDKAAEIELLKSQVLLLRADMENMRKRMERERQDTAKFAIVKFCQDILNVADGLERALYSFQDASDHETIIKGIEMVQKELSNILDKNGVKKFDALDKEFDPHKHEAMFEVKEGDQPNNTIVQVVQEGYMIHDRLLRPARVGVKK